MATTPDPLLEIVRGWQASRDVITSEFRLQGTGFQVESHAPPFRAINEFTKSMDARTRQLMHLLGADWTALDLEALHELSANFSKFLST